MSLNKIIGFIAIIGLGVIIYTKYNEARKQMPNAKLKK